DKFSDLSKNKEKIEVEFPELNVVEEMVGVISRTIQPINFDSARERQRENYNKWTRILKSMKDEMNINNLEDGNNWDQMIQYFDWSILPNNYQQMTQLYRMILYYKKMLERVLANLQITYEYTQTILITNNIKPNTEEDIIVRRLNHVRWMFQQIHTGFAMTKIVNDAKILYDRWNVYISANIDDDNYFQYKSKTEEYLAMIFAE
ncbi:15446_t:CDS:1, partial [Racocetra persica]